MRTEREHETRWDMHSNRQIEASKSGALAVTVLNSGSWLALLSQVGALQGMKIGYVLGFWGLGALLGTLIWLFIYLSALYVMEHDFHPANEQVVAKVNWIIVFGVATAVLSIICFGIGVLMLAFAFI